MTTIARLGTQSARRSNNEEDRYSRIIGLPIADPVRPQSESSWQLMEKSHWLSDYADLSRTPARVTSQQDNQRRYRAAAMEALNNPVLERILMDTPAVMMPALSPFTPEPAIAVEVRLGFAHVVAEKLRLFLDNLATRAGMPITKSEVTKRYFVSDGKTRIFVRQLISRSPSEVAAYADASSFAVDQWIEKLPVPDRQYFDDDIHCDIHWA